MNTETIIKNLFDVIVRNCNLDGGDLFDGEDEYVSCVAKLDNKSLALDFGSGENLQSFIIRVEGDRNVEE